MASIYFFHIVSNLYDSPKQKTFAMCINEAVKILNGHFEHGIWIHDELEEESIFYHRTELNEGYAPPILIIDVIKWLVDNNLWMDWMKDFDRITITKYYVE